MRLLFIEEKLLLKRNKKVKPLCLGMCGTMSYIGMPGKCNYSKLNIIGKKKDELKQNLMKVLRK